MPPLPLKLAVLSSIHITWELLKNVNSQIPPQTYEIIHSWIRPIHLCFTCPPVILVQAEYWCKLNIENHCFTEITSTEVRNRILLNGMQISNSMLEF